MGVAPPVLSRGLCGVLVCLYWARRGDVPLRPSGWPMLALRCLSGVGAVGLYYRSLGPGGTDMVTAAMLLKTSPCGSRSSRRSSWASARRRGSGRR